jgi:hypothetical protein
VSSADLLLKVCGFSDGRALIGWQTDPVDGQPASPLLLLRPPAGVLVDAGPLPVLGSSDQAPANRVQMDILHSFVIFLDGAQRVVEEAALPKLTAGPARNIDRYHGADFHRFEHDRDAESMRWIDDLNLRRISVVSRRFATGTLEPALKGPNLSSRRWQPADRFFCNLF